MLEGTMTHVVDINDTELHENIMRIQRKGMSHFNSNESDLESRHKYSVELASIIENNREKSADLKDQLSSYFANLYRQGISDDLLFDYKSKSFSGINALGHILLAPIVLLGLIHCGLFYWPIKFFCGAQIQQASFLGFDQAHYDDFYCWNIQPSCIYFFTRPHRLDFFYSILLLNTFFW
jgi:hypothetical protein